MASCGGMAAAASGTPGLRTGDGDPDPGGTIDADGMRPPNEQHAATSRMTPGACEDRHPASGCVPSTWGPVGRGISRVAACSAKGCPDNLVVHGRMCQDIQIVWLAVMFGTDMTASVLCRAAAGAMKRAGVEVQRLRRRRRRCIWNAWG